MFASVIVDISHTNVDKIFEYEIPKTMEIFVGSRVLVPFATKNIEGIVVALKATSSIEKTKQIIKPLDDFACVTEEQIELSFYLCKKYNTTMAQMLRLMFPSGLKSQKIKTQKYVTLKLFGDEFSQFTKTLYKKDGSEKFPLQIQLIEMLKAECSLPLSQINGSCAKSLEKKGVIEIADRQISRLPFKSDVELIEDFALTDKQEQIIGRIFTSENKHFLLHGATGSGKTEIYIRVIKECVKAGKGAILLVPEISLTPQTYKSLKQRFNEDIAVFHSGLSQGERYDEWLKVAKGEVKIVLGARSAVFAPVKNLGVIIIDEEHENSYKADNYPKYETAEVAKKRAEINDAMLILGSATPQIKTYYNAMQGEYVLLKMPNRLFDIQLPQVEIVDMREEMLKGNRSIISGLLYKEILQTLENKKQAVLFLNRRGYATFVMCRACGYTVKCDSCDVTMTYHKSTDSLICHYCGRKKQPQKICPECSKPYLKYFGTGTQQIEEAVAEMFEGARILRMDMDTMQKKDAYLKTYTEFAKGKADILIGTQMVSKGFDFENVELAAILAADTTLNLPDYRSAERTFSLITQVAGRAGRKTTGKVVLQTYNPQHYAIKYAKYHDYTGFYQEEINMRKVAMLPPFSTYLQIQFLGKDKEYLTNCVLDFIKKLKKVLLPKKNDIISIKAAEGAIKKINDNLRYNVLINVKNNSDIINEVYSVFNSVKYKDILVGIDINPQNMI